ncbi:MAG: plastocyanin/azurin family copper-binding protein [Verrucomicrobiota bacterium]|nr:plastocyanin/azurin family copper-binding protein [Verrucomicrobiota bacterium]
MNTSLKRNRHLPWLTALGLFLFALGRSAAAATVTVDVGPGGAFTFSPVSVTVDPGDTVMWVWKSTHHSVTSGTPGQPTGLFDSGIQNNGATFSFTFTSPGTYAYYCTPHGLDGMRGSVIVAGATPTPTPSPTPTPRPASQAQLLNISTRMRVQTGENVLIGGLIVLGNDPKKVLLRAIGPSLADQGITGELADPVLELRASDGSLITSNDNWQSTQQEEIEDTGAAPTEELESAIIATLKPDSYTAIVSGKNGSTGVGLIEGYDLDHAADSQLGNISTRGFVETGGNVMIGGFILGNGVGTTNVLLRALGPSLTEQGVMGALDDPILELRDENGALVMSNDNWMESQQAEIEATSIPPPNDLEAAMIVTVPATAHTAIVTGKNGGTGVGLIEVYRLP